jgi:glutamine synthetase
MERHKPTRSPQEVLVLCREKDVRAVDLRFTDLLGRQHQLTIPVGQLAETSFDDGFGFEGCAAAGQRGQGSGLTDPAEVLLVPQAETAWIDPFASLPTVVLTCSIQDPVTREDFAFDPRNVARRAENFLLNTGIADVALFGPEPEFYIFDEVTFENGPAAAHYRLTSTDGARHRGRHSPWRETASGPQDAPVSPFLADRHAHLRSEMMQTLIECGVEVDSHHRPVSTAGQAKIGIRPDRLVAIADSLMSYKYIVKHVARKHGKIATFMPKPLSGSPGSGMHMRLALARPSESLFGGNGFAGLSDSGLYAIGGLLAHAPALTALTNPSTNSFKRLASSAGAPIHLAYSQRCPTTACRIPMASPNPKAKHIEFRCPDGACNPYLALAAVLMAMIDGIQNKIHPGEPLEQESPEPTRSQDNAVVPRSLEHALEALEQDADFLLRGDVFSEELLQHWLAHKRRHELHPLQTQPHPYEFSLYFDA